MFYLNLFKALKTHEDMITLKKAVGRAQDLSDIAHLERFLRDAN
ncbi:MAG: hypothetical protein Q8R23_04305 [Methylotenera sp.]|jgi:hypothetical protein|nr:hypothetical protein [Methylotenera sp.]